MLLQQTKPFSLISVDFDVIEAQVLTCCLVVVISQTHGLVSQVRLATVARISVFIE